jgi:hypothetical protein
VKNFISHKSLFSSHQPGFISHGECGERASGSPAPMTSVVLGIPHFSQAFPNIAEGNATWF